uniref:DUF4939 domain-containing protein n=1 Tax=Fundulus heteroclitus TaxID=8078 RepID=A0A3Q2QSJ2_FUNHE
MDQSEQTSASEALSLRDLLARHGRALGQSEHRLTGLETASHTIHLELAQLTAQVAHLTSLLTSLTAPQPPPASDVSPPQPASPAAPTQAADPSTSPHGAFVPDPPPFTGELSKCPGFLLQCQMVFCQQPSAFASDVSRIYYVMGLLRDQALAWALAFTSANPLTTLTFAQFSSEISQVFDHPDHAGDASKRLLKLRQGFRSAAEFSVEFRTMHSTGHCFRPRTPVHLRSLASFLSTNS